MRKAPTCFTNNNKQPHIHTRKTFWTTLLKTQQQNSKRFIGKPTTYKQTSPFSLAKWERCEAEAHFAQC